MTHIPFPRTWLLGATLATLACSAQGRTLVDMAGRTVTFPDQVDKVFAIAPPVVPLVYALDPQRMISQNFPVASANRIWFDPGFLELPVIGKYLGDAPLPDPGLVSRTRPQLAIAWDLPYIDRDKVEQTFAQIDLPVLFVHLQWLTDYPQALALVGQVLGKEERARELSAYIEQTLARVHEAIDPVPEAERPRVYFAEGQDGLQSECDSAFHAEVITLAGGRNVLHCQSRAMCGHEPLTLDEIARLDPDVILAESAEFFAKVRTDAAWSHIRAVREGRVYRVPGAPMNWVGRPPSFMRALAIQWFANLLYPQRFPWDAQQETRRFFELFLARTPTPGQVQAILAQD